MLGQADSCNDEAPAAAPAYFEDDADQGEAQRSGVAVRCACSVVDHPYRVLAAWGLTFAVASVFALRLPGAVEGSYEPSSGMPSFQAKAAFERHFPGLLDQAVDSVLFVLRPGVDRWSLAPVLDMAAGELEDSIAGVARGHPGLLVGRRSWREATEGGEARESYVSLDGRAHLLQVVWNTSGRHRRTALGLAGELLAAVDKLNATYAPKGLSLVVTGPHALTLAIQAQTRRDVGVHSVMFLPVVGFMMYAHLWSVERLLLPALCGAVSLSLSFAIGYAVASSRAMDQNVPTLMAFLGIALCVDWSLFLLSRVREEEAEEPPHERAHLDSIITALSSTGMNVALSGAMIIACSACMLLLMPPAIASNAAGGCIAAASSLACCLSLLPACLAAFPSFFRGLRSHAGGGRGRPRQRRGDGSADDEDWCLECCCSEVPFRHRGLWYRWATLVTCAPCNLAIILCSCLLLLPAALRLLSYAPAIDDGLCLPPEDPAVLAMSRFGGEFAGKLRGTSRIYVLVESNSRCAGGARSDGFFRATCRTARGILGLGHAEDKLHASNLSGVAFYDAEGEAKCLSWRTQFHSVEEAYEAMTGNVTPSAHLLLTGHTRHVMAIPGDRLALYQTMYRQLWSQHASADNRAALIVVRVPWDTVTWGGFQLVADVRESLSHPAEGDAGTPDPCSGVRSWELSQTGVWYDYVAESVRSLPWAAGLSCLVAVVVLAASLRSVVTPVKLLLTVVLPLASVYGAAVWCFQDGLFDGLGRHVPAGGTGGLYWVVPCCTGMLLLALSLDYNIFYLGRVQELRRSGVPDMEAVRQGLASTGPVITCAGMIFAVEFSGLLFSVVAASRQIGFVVVAGILLDTLVVRSCLMPALLSIGASWDFWPRRLPSRGREASLGGAIGILGDGL